MEGFIYCTTLSVHTEIRGSFQKASYGNILYIYVGKNPPKCKYLGKYYVLYIICYIIQSENYGTYVIHVAMEAFSLYHL